MEYLAFAFWIFSVVITAMVFYMRGEHSRDERAFRAGFDAGFDHGYDHGYNDGVAEHVANDGEEWKQR